MDYTTVLNIIFLLVAAALCYQFISTGGIPMLRMMSGKPDAESGHNGHHSDTGYSP